MYIGVMVNYFCNNCLWNGGITQPIQHILRILCPMCDKELEVVDTNE